MLRIKQGDTFSLDAVVKGDGVALDITGWAVACELRTRAGTLIDTLTATVTSAASGLYTLAESAAGVTASWQVGVLEFDVKYTLSGVVVHTETVPIEVERRVTV